MSNFSPKKDEKAEKSCWFDFESYGPLLFSLLFAFLGYYIARNFFNVEQGSLVLKSGEKMLDTASICLQTYITVASIFVGFLMTTKSVFLSNFSNELMKIIKKGQHYKRLLSFFDRTSMVSLMSIGFSGLLLAVLRFLPISYPRFFIFLVVIWFILSSYCFAAFVRIIRLFNMLTEADIRINS